jgi:hypothetical protein
MSQHRSKRFRSSPLRLEEEQATLHFHRQEERELQLAIQASLEYDIDDSSDEDTSIVEHDIEMEEEEKIEPVVVANTAWTSETTAVVPPPFNCPSGPQTTVSSPFDLLQLFLPIRLLRTIATNTTA